MQRCEFCGTELPNNARFCGSCGRILHANRDWPTIPGSSYDLDLHLPTLPVSMGSQTNSTGLSAGQEELDVTVRPVESGDRPIEYDPFSQYSLTDEHQTILPDPLLLGMVNIETPPGSIPTVQGTPQLGNVPT